MGSEIKTCVFKWHGPPDLPQKVTVGAEMTPLGWSDGKYHVTTHFCYHISMYFKQIIKNSSCLPNIDATYGQYCRRWQWLWLWWRWELLYMSQLMNLQNCRHSVKLSIYYKISIRRSTCCFARCLLTHWGLVTPYGDRGLGQHLFKQWLVARRHQAITWTNVDLSSLMSSDNHLCASLQDIAQPSVTEIIWKIKYLKFHSDFPGTIKLNYICKCASRGL